MGTADATFLMQCNTHIVCVCVCFLPDGEGLFQSLPQGQNDVGDKGRQRPASLWRVADGGLSAAHRSGWQSTWNFLLSFGLSGNFCELEKSPEPRTFVSIRFPVTITATSTCSNPACCPSAASTCSCPTCTV